MSIAKEFDKWIGHLKRLELPVADWIGSGLQESEVKAKVEALGLDCPDGLIKLYTCANGVPYDEDQILPFCRMIESHYFAPLEQAINNYKIFIESKHWDNNWLPILENGMGDFYCVICDRKDNFFGSILCYIHGEPNNYIQFSSIENLLQVTNFCFDEGTYFLGEDGFLDSNLERVSDVAMAFNPDLPYYNDPNAKR